MKSRPLRLVVLLASALLASTLVAQSTPAAQLLVPSDELNRQLPKWLRFGGEYRARFEGSSAIGFKPDNGDYYLLNRFRINMKLLPSSWMKFVFQGQDSRVFWNSRVPDAPPYADTMDLRLAYMELGDTDTRPISLRVGRQELFFGEQRLIGHLNWTNTARSFDAVRATFRHQGYRLDAFAASVVNLRNGEFDSRIAGNNLHGLYGGIEKLVPNAIIEPYLLWRLEPGVRTESGALAHRDFKTVGFRWVGKLPANFDYGVEIAGQTGSVGTDSIRAWGGHWLLAYTIAGARYKPRLIAEYNHASGDKDPRDGKRGTFDQLYPTGHEKYGLADQVGWRNIHDVRSGVELKPHAKWLLTGSYHSWWRASSRDGLYNAAGVLLPGSTSKPGRYVGQELDFQAIYTASKQFQIGGGFAQIFPGALLKNATAGRPYNFPYLMLTTSF